MSRDPMSSGLSFSTSAPPVCGPDSREGPLHVEGERTSQSLHSEGQPRIGEGIPSSRAIHAFNRIRGAPTVVGHRDTVINKTDVNRMLLL